MSLLPVHQDQINAGIQKSLLDAGVPAPFAIGRSLTGLPDGPALLDFVTRAAAPDGFARTGSVLRLHYDKAGPIEAFYLTARALHLKGVGFQPPTRGFNA